MCSPLLTSLTETFIVTAGEVVQKHPLLSIAIQRGAVDTKALGDRISNNGKTLAKLIDKAEDDLAM